MRRPAAIGLPLCVVIHILVQLLMTEIEPDILQRLREIVRRDLKLGPDAVIADDMPFFNSDLDLDSLDILLLVTSIEKEFGMKIPSQAVGREVFANLSTLARYIQNADKNGTPDYLSRLPHGAGFRFVSKVTKVVEGQSAEGAWMLTGREDFFAAHFPSRPIVPGVLIAEALAQLSGLAGLATSGPEGKLVHIDIRFEQSVTPPAEIVLKSQFVRTIGALQQFDVRASVGPAIVASGSLTLHRGE
jgi:3-hydroxyacyl-[acyl-carrier-protein] dehydratase